MADRFEIERELKRIIEETLGADRVFSAIVTPYRDHSDEPALSIALSMKSIADIPDARKQSDLTHRLRIALAAYGDERFPYLYFDALDNLRSSDDADEFESLPNAHGRD